MLALRRAVIWSLGSLSLMVLVVQMLQWQPAHPVPFILALYNQALMFIAAPLTPLATFTLQRLPPLAGVGPQLDPHWPHLFLILALQFSPRAERFPGWNPSLEFLAKLTATIIGIAMAFLLSIALGTHPWVLTQSELLFFLFVLTFFIYFQNWLADWPSKTVYFDDSLEDSEVLPAFGPPEPPDTYDDEEPTSATFAALAALAFAVAFAAAAGGVLEEFALIRVIIILGFALCIVLGFVLWILFESGAAFFGTLLGILGNSRAPYQSRLTVFGRMGLLVMAIALWIGSVGVGSHPPAWDFLFQLSLMIVGLIAISFAQRAFLWAVPPDAEHRNYPLPSALGIFILVTALILGGSWYLAPPAAF